MLKYNSVSLDSARTSILNLSFQKLKAGFPNYDFVTLDSNSLLKELNDSLKLSLQWTSDQMKKIKDSKGFDRIKKVNEDGMENKYYGRIMSDACLESLKLLMKTYDLKYTICINKFEIASHRVFSNQEKLVLHLEVYDDSGKKMFGDKLSWPTSIFKEISYGVFSYKLKMAFDAFYSQTKGLY